MRTVDLSFLLVMLLASCSTTLQAESGETGTISKPAARAASLFNGFCLASPPSFNAIDQAATRSRFQVFMDRPILNGGRQKNWLIRSSDQETPLLLSVEDGQSVNGQEEVIVCGIAVTGVPGAELQNALSGNPRLGKPSKQVDPLPSGGKGVYWTVLFGASSAGRSQVVLAYGMPGLGTNAINVIYKHPR